MTSNETEQINVEVQTDVPVYGVAPGQACVCYDGERLLGGGWID